MKAVLKFRADLGRDLVTPQGGIMNFKNSIEKYITCEVHLHGNVRCFAKLDNGAWVAVFPDGNLDEVEVSPADFNDLLTTMEAVGANIRFTNHSAA